MSTAQETAQDKGNTKELRQQVMMVISLLAVVAFFAFGIVAPDWYFWTVITGLVLALLIRWPIVGLVAMTLTAPFINVEARWGTMHVPIVDLVAMATVVAVVARCLPWQVQNRSVHYRSIVQKYKAPIFFFVLFLGAATLSIWNAPDVWASAKYLLRPLAFFVIAYLALPMVVVTTARRRNAILWAFVAVGVVVAVSGLVSLYGQEDVAVRRVVPIPIFGVYPLGTNQNQIAEVLLVTLPAMALLATSTAKTLRARRAWALAMLPIAFVLLATLSRAGWIALAVEAAVVLAFIIRPTVRQFAVGVFVAGLLVSPFIGSLVRLGSVEAGQSANENRLILTTAAVDLWQQHPWIGNGPGTFVPLLSENRRYIAKFGSPLDAHGVLQKLIAEVGLLGTALFGIFWLSIALIFWRSYHGTRYKVHVTSSAALWFALFLGTSAFQLFGTSYFLGRFWLPIGLGLASLNMNHEA